MADRWFLALLVVRSRVQSEMPDESLADVQYRLVNASDPEAAYTRALELGRWEGQSYRNDQGQEVRWEFLGLRDLRELSDGQPVDGSEIFSELHRGDPSKLVMPKDKLTVFWLEANRDRTVEEVLENE